MVGEGQLARIRLGAFGGLLAFVAACSLARSLDGFSDRFGEAEGGTPERDATGSDAPAEALSPTAGPWCASHADAAVFCEDFDRRDASPLGRFDLVTEEARGKVSVDGDVLLASTPANAEEPSRASASKYGTTTRATSAFVALDVRFDKVNGSGTTALQPLSLFFESGATSYQVGITIRGPQSASVFEYTDPDASSFALLGSIPSIADGSQHRVELAVDLEAALVSLRIDGTLVAGLPKLNPGVTAGRVLAVTGIGQADPGHDGWTLRVDNVIFASE